MNDPKEKHCCKSIQVITESKEWRNFVKNFALRRKLSKTLLLYPSAKTIIGGTSELPMWLTEGFVVTFFLEGGGDTVHTCYSRVEGTFMCGTYSCVEGTFMCGSYSHVEGTFTCGTYMWIEHSPVGVTHKCGKSHQRNSSLFDILILRQLAYLRSQWLWTSSDVYPRF